MLIRESFMADWPALSSYQLVLPDPAFALANQPEYLAGMKRQVIESVMCDGAERCASLTAPPAGLSDSAPRGRLIPATPGRNAPASAPALAPDSEGVHRSSDFFVTPFTTMQMLGQSTLSIAQIQKRIASPRGIHAQSVPVTYAGRRVDHREMQTWCRHDQPMLSFCTIRNISIAGVVRA